MVFLWLYCRNWGALKLWEPESQSSHSAGQGRDKSGHGTSIHCRQPANGTPTGKLGTGGRDPSEASTNGREAGYQSSIWANTLEGGQGGLVGVRVGWDLPGLLHTTRTHTLTYRHLASPAYILTLGRRVGQCCPVQTCETGSLFNSGQNMHRTIFGLRSIEFVAGYCC